MKSWLKYSGIGIGAIILIVGLLFALTQTSIFRTWVKNQIVARVNGHLNGQLSIGRLDGNLFTRIQMTDIYVTAVRDTVLFIPRVSVDLSPWRLISGELKIDSVIIESPVVNLIQSPDSTWSIAKLARTDSVPPAHASRKTGTSDFRVLLNDVILRRGSVAFVTLDTTLRRAITQIGIRFTAQYSDTSQQLELGQLGFDLDKPRFRLEQLSLKASRSGNRITLGNLVITTARNQLSGEGTYAESDHTASGNLGSQSFDLAELGDILPALNLDGHPLIEIETHLVRDSLIVKLDVTEPPQRIEVGIHVANVSKTLDIATHPQVRYYLDVGLTNFSLAHWLRDTSADFQANGTIKVAGTGLAFQNADITLAANLFDLRAYGRSIGQITGTAHYSAGNLNGQFDASGGFGDLKSTFSVLDMFTAQKFTTDIVASHFNLFPFLKKEGFPSDINFKAQIKGSGLDKERLKGTGKFILSASNIADMRIDSAIAGGSFSTKDYRIDSFYAASDFGSLSMTGYGAVSGINDLSFQLRLKSLAPARKLLRAEALSGEAMFSGAASGTLDSLVLTSDLALHKFQYNSVGIESVSGRIAALIHRNSLKATGQMVALRPGMFSYGMDSVAASTDLNISLDSGLTVLIPAIDLLFAGQHWRGGSPDTRITLREDEYRVENLNLRTSSDFEGGAQSVSIAGLFSMTGNEDITLKIDRLDLEKLQASIDLPASVAGSLTAEAHLGGTASSPIFTANVTIDSGLMNQFSYRSLRADASYEGEKLALSTVLQLYQGDSLAITGFVPLNLSLLRTGDLLYRDRQLDMMIQTSGLPFSIIQMFGQPFTQADGLITAEVRITNTVNSPVISGSFGLRDGKVSLPKYGLEYSDILTNLSVNKATLTVDTLQAKRDEGSLTGSGRLQFEQSLLSGMITMNQFDLHANKMYVVHHKDYQIQITGEAHLTGSSLEPRFAGNITVLRSKLSLAALLKRTAEARDIAGRSLPLLVEATRAVDSLADSANAPGIRRHAEADTNHSDWYKNLRGQFKISIPRNTWLRSPSMNLEIGEGDIDLVKNGPDCEIFGPLKILRGQYNLYGRHFTILQGSLLFQGGVKYNPEISMQAQFVFRTADREKRALRLDVSGKAFSPVIHFALDDNEIEERDAVAYIMYGRSMDELTTGQKSSAGVAQTDLARGAAANVLSNQLSQALGSKLGLDVIDINSLGSLAATSMTVGKYLTTDLFMSYQRSFGQGPDATPGNVTFEYELNRYLLLQLLQGDDRASGFDFIFKYQH